MSSKTLSHSTRVTKLTPDGRGAVASLLVERCKAVSLVDSLFHPAGKVRLCDRPIGQVVLGRWGKTGGEELVVCCTAEDRVEIHCHGGSAAVEAILESLHARGCRAVEWAEWIGQEEIDQPIRVAARQALSHATTSRCAAILLDQYQGALRRAIQAIIKAIDAGKLSAAGESLDKLFRSAAFGLRLTKPWSVVLAGEPNVGKSSLINALLGFERAIVFDQPGTTRDVVTARTAIDGWPVELSDTAGLRERNKNEPTSAGAQDTIETAGIRLARERIEGADLILYQVDASQPGWKDKLNSFDLLLEDSEHLPPDTNSILRVVNKIDALETNGVMELDHLPEDVLAVSALMRIGIEPLIAAISKRLVPLVPSSGEAVVFTRDQLDLLNQTADHLRNNNAKQARTLLEAMVPLLRHAT